MPRSDEEQDFIDAHIDAGTCYICDKPVKDGDARYAPTQAHYDCHVEKYGDPSTATQRARESLNKLQSSIDNTLRAISKLRR